MAPEPHAVCGPGLPLIWGGPPTHAGDLKASPPSKISPENVGVREAVHKLHFAQHVATVAHELVHLQHHDLA